MFAFLRHVRRCAAALIVVLALGAFVAPASAMTLYTSEVLPDVQALIDEFQKEHPGTEVKVFRTGSGEIVAKLRAELEAHNPQADAVWIADPSFLDYLVGLQGLARIDVRVAGYPAAYSYQNGAYHEVRLIQNIIAVNTQRLGTLPRPNDWTDLVRPEYRDLVAMPDPNYSGGALATLGALTKRYGFDFFVKLKANGMRIERSNPLLLQKLAQGEYAAALMVDFNVRQEIRNGAPLQVVYPRGGAILIPTPIGVLTQAKDAATADAFVRFLVTRPAQAIFADRGYAPVVAGVPFPGAPSARTQTLPAPSMSLAEGADLLRRFNELFGLSE
jgi:iron(III) transport system substrate-binding protein